MVCSGFPFVPTRKHHPFLSLRPGIPDDSAKGYDPARCRHPRRKTSPPLCRTLRHGQIYPGRIMAACPEQPSGQRGPNAAAQRRTLLAGLRLADGRQLWCEPKLPFPHSSPDSSGSSTKKYNPPPFVHRGLESGPLRDRSAHMGPQRYCPHRRHSPGFLPKHTGLYFFLPKG